MSADHLILSLLAIGVLASLARMQRDEPPDPPGVSCSPSSVRELQMFYALAADGAGLYSLAAVLAC